MVSAEHKALVISTANDTVEILYDQSGTDTTENPYKWYFNLDRPAKAIFVKADKISQIVEINGHPLKSPINIAANGTFSHNIDHYQFLKYVQLKIKVLNDSTLIEVFGSV
jgi:hypothetical protein